MKINRLAFQMREYSEEQLKLTEEFCAALKRANLAYTHAVAAGYKDGTILLKPKKKVDKPREKVYIHGM